jgi:hypothetical protein
LDAILKTVSEAYDIPFGGHISTGWSTKLRSQGLHFELFQNFFTPSVVGKTFS